MRIPYHINADGKIEREIDFAARFAAAMIAPLRRSLDYSFIARKALVVEPMPQGALPYIPYINRK